MDQRLNWSLVLVIFILASHVSDTLARHHHIKLRHGRHRRQHGDSFLPTSFVSDTNEEETGNWGPWSTPSSCSRSCGGGVAHQTRRCHDLTKDGTELCTGSKRRFFSCNIQNCPDPMNDFRAEQCAAYNNQTVLNSTYDWIPYTGSLNKCDLNCMPREERFYYEFNRTVIDGTPCSTEGNDVCVEGRCMPVGCDMMLGSGAKEDKCRECGGNGSDCSTVVGLLTDNLQVGYNDILLIPAGATNIAVNEVRPSNNYLAIRNATGYYYLNGNWRIDFPRSLRFAGTVFHYERRPKELSAADIIKAQGPISEAIYIVMLYQDNNVGVKYEYSIPKRFSERSDPDGYTWVAEEFSDCSASCGGGFRSRLVRCVRRRDNEEVDDQLCDQLLEPDGTKACGEEPCAPGWVLGDWGPCNKKCGPGGEQTREIRCEQLISGGIPSLVGDDRCLDLIGPKDIEIRDCNTDIVCAKWHVGPWKPCDHLCGEGKEIRQVTCFKKVNEKIVVLPDSECAEKRPESEKDCDLRPCTPVDWVVSKWSGCDGKCGLTQETRTTRCVTLDGKVYPEDVCNADTKPELVRECSAQEKCKYQWYATQWSECSAKCGTGIQTRRVFCGTSLLDSDTITKVEDENCDPTGKYNDTKECIAEFEVCKGEWFAGPWSECSKPCGGGDMSRKVICMKDNRVVPPSGNCYEHDIVFSNESCNKKACEDDETIPMEPGKPSAPAEDLEECEEYENNEFAYIVSDSSFRNFEDASLLHSPTEKKLFDSDPYNFMMGDNPASDSSGQSDMMLEKSESMTDEDGNNNEEGSGSFEESITTAADESGFESTPFTDFPTSFSNFDSTESSSTAKTEATTNNTSEDADTTEKPDIESDIPTGLSSSETTDSLSTNETISLSGSEATELSSSKETESSSTDVITSSSSLGVTKSSGEETTEPSDSETTVSSSSEATVSSSSESTESLSIDETISSSGSKATGISSSETTIYSSSETTDLPSTEATASSSGSKATELSSSKETESSSTDVITSSSSSGVTESSSKETTKPSDSETTVSSSAEAAVSSRSETTDLLSTDETMSSSGSKATEISSSKTTIYPSSETTDLASTEVTTSLSGSEATELSSSEGTESSSTDVTTSSSSSGVTESSSKETTKPSDSETTVSSSSEAAVSSRSETTDLLSTDETVSSSGSKATEISSSKTTIYPSSETTDLASTEVTTSISGSEATELSSSEGTELSSTDVTTSSSSSGVTESSSKETTEPSDLETTVSSSSEATVSSSSESTDSLSTDETISSSGSKATEISSSKTTIYSSSETTDLPITEVTTSSSGSRVTELSSSKGTESSSTDVITSSSSLGATKSSGEETTEPSDSETTVLSSSEATVSSSSESTDSLSTDETISSSGSKATEISSSKTTIYSSSETTDLPITEVTTSSSGSRVTELSSSKGTESSSTDVTTSSSSSGVTEPSSKETTKPSDSETTISSSSEAAVSSSSETTDSLSTDETISSSGLKVTELSTSESTISSLKITASSGTVATISSSGSQIEESSTSDSTGSSSSVSTVSSLETTTSPSTEATVSSFSPDTTTPGSSTSLSSKSSLSSTTTNIAESISIGASEQSTETGTETTESDFVTETWDTTFSSESATIGVPSETTKSGTTETDEDLDTTEQSHSTDIWTTFDPTYQTRQQSRRKCKPRKVKKTCKSSRFGCCYDGIKAATGPFGKGCTIPKTCKDVEFGCCPDGLSPAAGPNYQGCPDSQCGKTLFGCCKDNVTPSQGNDYEGCPVPCSETEFGCCPDEKTPAAGTDNLGCCNTTEYGCCPDGIEAASGPDGKGCEQVTTPEVSTTGISTPEVSLFETSTTEPGTSVTTEPSTSVTTEPSISVTTEPSTSVTTEPSTSVTTEPSPSVTTEPSPSVTTEPTTTTTEAQENCNDTEFGCCPDDETKATGKNYEGCNVINTENCTASYFGCCPDGASAALGPHNEDCPNACTYSIFGCCDDGATPAHGPNKEGCCLAQLYGCCPDNIRHALGPELHGCGCEYSRYGCCPDNTTTAKGRDNEGCGCEYSTHGCCPDRLTPATGPNFEGCSCTTYQFGCCPDGVSIAKGQFGQGCRCENTEFKCCSDGITPAKGPNYAGCTCDASKYGCCPDGIEEAQGESFEGCLTIVTPPGAACALEKERGPCRNFSVKWFFDTAYGGCSRFWYGSCEGNDNRFKNQQECKDVCVEPKGRDACFLPKITGPCEGYNPMWYYDTDRKQCGQFIYSGCLGNKNKFKTRDECEELCVIPDDLDPCEQPKETGPCQGNFTRWYFDRETGSCEQFNYGGCKANKNNFQNQVSCQQQCLKPGRSRVQDVCVLEKDPGPCPGSLLRWYFDTERKSCRQFVYGGCKGNGNKFRTYAACKQRCPVRDSCALPREEGNCEEKLARWSFNQLKNRCMPFYYTGCGGNKNNYETLDACDNDCPPKIEPDICLLPAVYGECRNYTRRWYYDSLDQRCRQFYYGGCGGNTNNFETEYACINRCIPSAVTQAPVIEEFRTEFCFLPEDRGPCNEETIKWFYDSRYGICEPFRYGGCEGNGNKFATAEECQSRCGNVQDLCVLPPVVGPCGAQIAKYHYDSRTDTCKEFMYGGCQGNQNNFEDKKSCEQRCRKLTDVITTTPAVIETTPLVIDSDPRSPACSAPFDAGSCSEEITAYYYDESEGACQAFQYGGCDGSANRFETEEQCERICGKFRGQDLCNLRADPGPCEPKFSKFYYDPVSRGCHEFVYGGCDGNANRFTSASECESICIHREEPPVPGNRTAKSNAAICREPVSTGTGLLKGAVPRYYYDDDRRECLPFVYSGTGGNLNRFKSFASCIRTCSQMPNEIDNEDDQDQCLQARINCDTIQCPYGKNEILDQDECPRCSCIDLCGSTNCSEGTQCAIELVPHGNYTAYKSVCRLTLKPGVCPNVLNSTTCEKECSSDADCIEDLKCCINGCGSSCLKPSPSQPLTIARPEYDVTDPSIDGYVPAKIWQPEETNLRAAEGGYVIMKCIVTGYPRPAVSWRRGDMLIDSSVERYHINVDGSLQIVSLYRKDAGIYTCTADHVLSRPVKIQYVLEITAPSHCIPTILGEPNYHVTVTLNSPALLPCYVSGWPRPTVRWWRENQLVPTNNGTYEVQGDFTLRIHRVDLVNLGIYTCQAYNGIQKAVSWSVTLQAPGPVYNVKPGYEKYLRFLIDRPRRHEDITTELDELYTREKLPTTSSSRPLYLTDPNPYDSPSNSPNKSSYKIDEIDPRVPVKVNISTDGVSFPEGSEFSINCHVNGMPFPRISWYKDDIILEANNRIKIDEASKITIRDAERNDTGKYRCEAANEYTNDSDTVDIKVAGIYIHPNCQDNLYLANCDLIVKANFCKHKFYTQYCCRTCTKAGQLPSRGPHLDETKRKKRSILSFF